MVSQPGGSTKKSKFTETQIVSILKQADADIPVKDICRQAGISTPTYYQWKSKYGGMGAIEAFDVGVLVGLAGLVREATYWWMIEYKRAASPRQPGRPHPGRIPSTSPREFYF